MIIRIALPIALTVSGCSGDAKTEIDQEACRAILHERTLFRREVAEKAKRLDAKLRAKRDVSDGKPSLKTTEKLLQFQADTERGENSFKVRLRGCRALEDNNATN